MCSRQDQGTGTWDPMQVPRTPSALWCTKSYPQFQHVQKQKSNWLHNAFKPLGICWCNLHIAKSRIRAGRFATTSLVISLICFWKPYLTWVRRFAAAAFCYWGTEQHDDVIGTLRVACWLCMDESTERALRISRTGLKMHITKSQRQNKRDKWKPNILQFFLETVLNLKKLDLVASCSPWRARCLKCMVVVVPAFTFASKLHAKFVENPAAPFFRMPGNPAVASTGSKLLGITLKQNSFVWSSTYDIWNHMIPHAYVIPVCADCCKAQGHCTTESFQNLCGQLWLFCRAFLTKAPMRGCQPASCSSRCHLYSSPGNLGQTRQQRQWRLLYRQQIDQQIPN